MNCIALIPARGGSKGIPRKNIVPLAGKPLIAWTIEAALASGVFSRIIVSTDDEEIAGISRQHGGDVPFLRPARIAQDDTPAIDVAVHALDFLRDENVAADYLMLLQPTSPLRTAEDIVGAWQLAREREAVAVIGVTEANPHPYLARRIGADGVLVDFLDGVTKPSRRQDYPAAFAINGAIYLSRAESLRATRAFQPPGTLAFVMPAERSVDIDSSWDLRLAAMLLEDANH